MIFESVRLSPVLSMGRQSVAAVVSELALLPRRSSWMLSRTAARARSAQGASQFAAGYAAVRLTRHGDVRHHENKVRYSEPCCGGPEIHVYRSGLFAPVVLLIELHVYRAGLFAPVADLE